MADGRKNEEIKVIKNPLLRQNLLLEEISGISFVVPAVSEKLETVDNGSSQGLEVSQVGAKSEGSDGKPQETQSFTDIPLDVPEPTEESKPPPSSASEKQEGTSFGFHSIIPSFVPLFAPQSLKNTPPKEQPTPTENLQASKRVSTPETVVPQLLPPASSDKPPLSASLNPIKQDASSLVSSPTPSASSAASYPGTPPPAAGPPPLASNIHRNTNINPYALKRPTSTALNSTIYKSQANESLHFMPPPLSSVGASLRPEASNSHTGSPLAAPGIYSFPGFNTFNKEEVISGSSFSTTPRDSISSSPLVTGSSVTSNIPPIPAITTTPNIPLYPPTNISSLSSMPAAPSLTNITPTSSISSFSNMPLASSLTNVTPASSFINPAPASSFINPAPASSFIDPAPASFLSSMPTNPPTSFLSTMPVAPLLTNITPTPTNVTPVSPLNNMASAPPMSSSSGMPLEPPLTNNQLTSSITNADTSISNLPLVSSIPNISSASIPPLSTVPLAHGIYSFTSNPSILSKPSNVPLPVPSITNASLTPSLSSLPPVSSIPNIPQSIPPCPPAPIGHNVYSHTTKPSVLSNPSNGPLPVPSITNTPPVHSLTNVPPMPSGSSLSIIPPAPSLSNISFSSTTNVSSTPSLSNIPLASFASNPPVSTTPSYYSLPNMASVQSHLFPSNVPSIPTSNLPSLLPPSNLTSVAPIPSLLHNPPASSTSSVSLSDTLPSMSGISQNPNISAIPPMSMSAPMSISSSNSSVYVPGQTEIDSPSNNSDKNTEQTILSPTTTNSDSGSICNSNDPVDKVEDISDTSKLQNVKGIAPNPLEASKESSNSFSASSIPLSSENSSHGLTQCSPNPKLVSLPSSVSSSIFPPPMSNTIISGSANPYALKKGHHSSPYVSKEIIVSPSPNALTAPFFNQSSPYSSNSTLSGPGVHNSTSNLQQLPSTNQSNDIINSKNENLQIDQFPLVKNFASAISNFISPSKPESNDSIIENTSVISPPNSNIEFSKNNYNTSSLVFSSTLPDSASTQSMQHQVDKNISLSNNIPFFNTSNPANNNGFGLNSNITDNTVCVSAITTALSSVAPSVGIHTTPSSQVDVSYTHLAPQVSDNKQSETFCRLYNFQNQQPSAFNNNLFNNNVIDDQTQNTNSMTNIYSNQNNSETLSSTTVIENNNNLNLQLENSCTSQANSVNENFKPETITQKNEQKSNIIDDISKNKVNFPGTIPVIQPIPTFNYFSSSQNTSLSMPDKGNFLQTKQVPELPTSSFFKPIESPNVSASAFQSQNPPHSNQSYQNVSYSNILPSAPPKISFPPPNTTIPPKTATKTPTKPEPEKSEIRSDDKLDFEELDQIPLEGSAVPLYRPDYLSQKKKAESPGEVGNSYRISGGLKKPTYAPVPDLGLTGRKSYPEPSRSNSLSSQEEMAAIEAQSSRVSPTQGNTSPSGSTTLDTYYSNLVAAPSYRPPYHHWFFKSGQHKKSPWTPFSMADSLNLEQIYTSSEVNEETKVPTDGGRYDVEIIHRKRTSVYWEEPAGEVRRCSWFVKSITDSRYTPYDENIAALLEDEYKKGCESNEWNRRIELADGEVIILHSPTAMAHHVRSSSPDAWSTQPTLQQKPRVVKRGVEDFNIPKGEAKQVDHLLLMVHGVGKACDLRFRSLVEVVDDFRSIAQQLVGSHFHSGVENGNVGRVEILPVEWHGALHTEAINDRLSAITLPSIPRAREFTNETLLDILFYTSPVFAETIVQAVGQELNRVYTLYKARNPGFRGKVSLGGHSLGSLILFDILCHQKIQKPVFSTQSSLHSEDDEAMDELGCLQKTKAKLNRRISYLTIGPGTGQPYTNHPQLSFQPRNFFALGSPIGMFVTVRGLESLGEDFKFPTCPSFFNIFHPNDPVAYRIEALIKPEMATVPAVLIPHHKGRKRMHLELKETMAHVTAALKQKLVDSMKNTWNAVYHLTLFNKKDNSLQGEVNQVIEDEVMRDIDSDPPLSVIGEEGAGTDVKVGKLNGGRRVDYVLQEAPLETFNQYISAIRSHLVYWESEDTTLMILKEIYGGMGIAPDTQVPQAILPFDLAGEADSFSDYTYSIGALPTQFIRK